MKTRAVHALAFLSFGLTCAAAAMPFATRLPNFLVPDDGFFYAQIAFNLSQLHRSTFDGIHTTSGYHLPWAFVLAAVSAFVGLFSKAKAVHLFAHLAASFTLIGWTSHSFFRSWLFRVAAFVLLTSYFSLTEMALVAPLLLALFREDSSPKAPLSQAIIAATLALVRIDLVCVPLFLAVTQRDHRRGARLAAGALVGAITQLALMRIGFGHFFSVAAELKTAGAFDRLGWIVRANLFPSAFQFLVYVGNIALGALVLRLRPGANTWRLVGAAILFPFLHTFLSSVRPWYWVPSWITLLYLLERSLDTAAASTRVAKVARLAIITVIGAFVLHGIRVEVLYRPEQRNAQAFMDDLRRIVPAGTALYTWDNPGFLGFLSDLRVVDGDGLVNDYAYAKRLTSGSLETYLDEEGICWVVTDYAGWHPQLSVNGLVLDAPGDLTLMSEHRHQVGTQADFVLYRLTAPRCQGVVY